MRPCAVLAILLGVSACVPPAPAPPRDPVDVTPAVTELRDGRFPEAERAASAVLSREKNSVAAAVRAIARYDQAAEALAEELGTLVDRGETLKFLDHEQGRASWQKFLTSLEAVDADLAIASADSTFSLELCLACWSQHDWNHNGRVDERDAKFFELEFDGHGADLPAGDKRRRPTYHFDVGDIYWARAMVAFQRAAAELVLAYRWSELDKLLAHGDPGAITIKLIDADRVHKARELVILGLAFSEEERQAYLAETDDDREWVPNPRQKNYAMPLEVDATFYAQWGAILSDVQRLLAGQEGVPLRDLTSVLVGGSEARLVPAAFLDLGAMLRSPTDIVIDFQSSTTSGDYADPKTFERLLRGLLGHGYAQTMRASPLVERVRHMKDQLDQGEDTFERKLRYLLWVN